MPSAQHFQQHGTLGLGRDLAQLEAFHVPLYCGSYFFDSSLKGSFVQLIILQKGD